MSRFVIVTDCSQEEATLLNRSPLLRRMLSSARCMEATSAAVSRERNRTRVTRRQDDCYVRRSPRKRVRLLWSPSQEDQLRLSFVTIQY